MMIKNNDRLMIRNYYEDSSGGEGATGLDVDTEKLATFGSYLVQCDEKLIELLGALDTQMSSITNGWADPNGAAYKDKFSAFITESKAISAELNALGTFAVSEAAKYDTILSTALSKMGGGS